MVRSMEGRDETSLVRFVKFNSVGAMGIGVQLLTLVVLTELAGLPYFASTALGVVAAVLHNFFWHECWTWRDRTNGDPAGRWTRFARFTVMSGTVSIGGNVVFTWLFATGLGAHYAVANLMAIASCSVLNFLASDRFVFSDVSRLGFVPARSLSSDDLT